MTDEQRERLLTTWAEMTVALVRAYPGERRTMWERIPNVMVAGARQSTRLERWLTFVLRALQVPTTGAPSKTSVTTAWGALRKTVRALPPDPETSERRALQLLPQEICGVAALARVRWESVKSAFRQIEERDVP